MKITRITANMHTKAIKSSTIKSQQKVTYGIAKAAVC